ncbi:MAG: hypothetical protein ACO36A_09390 [Ilumatobacteraceae bacterium]
MTRGPDPALVEERIGHSFRDRELLVTACTRGSRRFAMLEFLGDSFLGLSVGMSVLEAGGGAEEHMRLVGNKHLAKRFHLVFTGRGDGEQEDYVETVVGAVVLDAGVQEAVRVAAVLHGSFAPPQWHSAPAVMWLGGEPEPGTSWFGATVLKAVCTEHVVLSRWNTRSMALLLNSRRRRLMNHGRLDAAARSLDWTVHPLRERRTVMHEGIAATMRGCGWETTRGLARALLGLADLRP